MNGSSAKFAAKRSMLFASTVKSSSRSSERRTGRRFRRADSAAPPAFRSRPARPGVPADASRLPPSGEFRGGGFSAPPACHRPAGRDGLARSRPSPAPAFPGRQRRRTAIARARASVPAATRRTARAELRCAAFRIPQSSRAGRDRPGGPSTCPSFTNVGPSSCSASRMRCGGSSCIDSAEAPHCRICPARSSTPETPRRRTTSPRPWRISTEVISCRRGRSRIVLNATCSMSPASVRFLVGARLRQRVGDSAQDAARKLREARADLGGDFHARRVRHRGKRSKNAASARSCWSPPSCPSRCRSAARYRGCRRSSGRIFSLAASAAWPAVARKSSSSFFIVASACLISVSDTSLPVTAS